MRRASLYHAYQLASIAPSDLDLLYSENFPYMNVLLLSEAPEYQPVLPTPARRNRLRFWNMR